MKISDLKTLSPIQMVTMAYNESNNAIDFCNWFILNRPMLEAHESDIINNAYYDGTNDMKQDPDHLLKSGEYFKDIFYTPGHE